MFTQAHDTFDFGTPGGTTNAFVNVLNGGTVRTQNVNVGVGPSNAAATGTEQAFGTVTIDGVGSKWIATRNTIGNTAAFFGVGSGIGGHGTVSVQNGGQLIVDGSGGSTSSFDALNIGQNGGSGTVTVTGLGSSLQVLGNNPLLQVGRSGASGQGSLNVLAGGTASALTLNVGRDGASGIVVVDGAASQLSLVGVGTPGVAGAAGVSIGQTGGAGQLTVSNGGRLLISDGGGDSRPQVGLGTNPYLNLGRDAGSSGSLTITGAGSTVELSSTSLGLAPGTPDNFNPYMAVGRFSGSSGNLAVSNGGKLLLQGNAVSTVADSRATTLTIGGSDDTNPGGNGTALVSGAGSEIRLSGSDTFIAVGRGTGANGQLTIANQAMVSATNMAVGRAGGAGSLALDNGVLNMSGQQTGNLLSGASLTIGQSGGTGVVSVTNGSQVNLTNPGSAGATLNLGGTGSFPLGSGTLNVSGASTINITASSGLATFSVGRDGNGSASFAQNSSMDVGDGTVHVGRLAGGTGALSLAGGSSLSAGIIGIGGSSDSVAGGSGNALVTGAGSELRASGADGFISVGRSGTGSLSVTDQGTVSATILNVGRAEGGVGTLSVDNAAIALSGQQTDGQPFGRCFVDRQSRRQWDSLDHQRQRCLDHEHGVERRQPQRRRHADQSVGHRALFVSGSQISVVAQPGQATVRVGHDGNGTATFNASSLRAGSVAPIADGSVIIAGQPGSTGTMTLNAGSVVNAGYVGVGATKSAVRRPAERRRRGPSRHQQQHRQHDHLRDRRAGCAERRRRHHQRDR